MEHDRDFLETIPAEWRERAAETGCSEAGFGAGPGSVGIKLEPFDPPATLPEAVAWVHRYSGVFNKAHIRLTDGHVLWFWRDGFWRVEFRETAPRPGLVVRHAPDHGEDAGAEARSGGGILRRSYNLTRWARWDDEIHTAVQEFKGRFTLAPNLLLASEVTHARIDMAAKKQHIHGPDGEAAPEDEHTPIAGFRGPDYDLEFCIDDELETGRFSLVYDDDPDGGEEEPLPDEDTDEADAKVAVVA